LNYLAFLATCSTLLSCSHQGAPQPSPQELSFYRIRFQRAYEVRDTAESKSGPVSVKVTVLYGERNDKLTLKVFFTASPEMAQELIEEEAQGIQSLHDNERDPYFADPSAAPEESPRKLDSSFTKTDRGTRYTFLERDGEWRLHRLGHNINYITLLQCGERVVRLEKLVPEKAWDQGDQKEAASLGCN